MIRSRLIFVLAILILSVNISYGETYRIEPGDTLSIIVMDYPEYNRSIQVGEDGYVIYFGAQLYLADKTLAEGVEVIQNQINQYGRVQDPIVILDPLRQVGRSRFDDRGKGYLVWGAVSTPGYYSLTLQDEIGLYKVLAIAGGWTEGADQADVQIIRVDRSIEKYDLSPNQEYRKILVKDGDIVFVPSLGWLEVRGRVQKPGRFPIRDRIRIDHALAMADGPIVSEVKADLASITVVKANGKNVELNIADPSWKDQLNRDGADRYYLEDGDLVYVPPLAASEIQGQVQVPDKKVQFHRRIRIDHALVQAGGPDRIADLSSVVIKRKSGESTELNIDEEFWKNEREQDDSYYLEDGDVLYLPSAFKREPVYVLGYVRVPGPYRIRDPITPREVISRAGGFEESANRGKVKVWRKDGTIQVVKLSWNDGEDATGSKTLVYPGDSLEVGKRFRINWSLILSVISVTTVAISLTRKN